MSLEETFLLKPVLANVLSSDVSWSNHTPAVSEHHVWYPGIVIAAVYGFLILIGLVGNITLIKTFCAVTSRRTVPNLFMSSLALGDLLLLITCAPVDASRYLVDQWLFGRVGCKVIPFVQLTSVGVSVFTLTALSADRYKAIVRPMDIQTSNTTAKILLRAASIWILSMILAIPEAIFSDLHTFNVSQTNETFVTCAPYPQARDLHPKIHSMVSFLIFYVVPLFIISIYYAFIARSLISSACNIPVEGNMHVTAQVCDPCLNPKAPKAHSDVIVFYYQEREEIKSRKRLAKMVLVFVGLFAACWLPSHIIYLYRSYHYSQVDTSLLHFIFSVCARILAFTNSCVNPFALYLMSKSFQKQFNKQLCCCRLPPFQQSKNQGQSTIHMTLPKKLSTIQANHLLASASLVKGNQYQVECKECQMQS